MESKQRMANATTHILQAKRAKIENHNVNHIYIPICVHKLNLQKICQKVLEELCPNVVFLTTKKKKKKKKKKIQRGIPSVREKLKNTYKLLSYATSMDLI